MIFSVGQRHGADMSDGNESQQGATRFSIDLDDGVMAGRRWRRAGLPPLLFCHATGFCASVYKQMLEALSADYDVFALDMRGHGRTALPADAAHLRSWDIYARDIAAFLDAQNRHGWTLAGHSMGAVTAAMAAQGRVDIAALRLIEPVAAHPLFALAARTPVWPLLSRRIPLAAKARRRRAEWPSRHEALDHYVRKALFQNWADGVLEDYLEDGLVIGTRRARLACDPAWEAATFAAQANGFWGAVRRAPALVEVFAADHPTTTVWSSARARFNRLGAHLTLATDLTHLAPMEDPGRLARFVAGSAAP